MSSNPFETPQTDPTASKLAALEPLTVRYKLRNLSVAASLKYALFQTRGGWVMLASIAASIALLFVSPLFGGVLLAAMVYALLKLALGARRPSLGEPDSEVQVTLMVSPAGVRLEAGAKAHEARWAELTHFALGQGAILIYPTQTTVWVVATNELSPIEVEQLRAWLSSCLPTRPRTTPKRAIWRALALWLLLILMFWAIYQIVATKPLPTP